MPSSSRPSSDEENSLQENDQGLVQDSESTKRSLHVTAPPRPTTTTTTTTAPLVKTESTTTTSTSELETNLARKRRKTNSDAMSSSESDEGNESQSTRLSETQRAPRRAASQTRRRVVFSAKQPLALDKLRDGTLTGAIRPPPTYTCDVDVSTFKADVREKCVSGAMRLILALQGAANPVTGSMIKKHALIALGGLTEKEARTLMPWIRVTCKERFMDIFGYHLFAGTNPEVPLMDDKWQLTNALDNDEVSTLTGQRSMGAKERGVLMTMLGLVMANNDAMREVELLGQLVNLGLVEKEAKEYLSLFTRQGYLQKTMGSSSDAVARANEIVYGLGLTTLHEIGQRAIVQFLLTLTQGCSEGDATEESALLRLFSKGSKRLTQ